jgi:tetratricopeptide (TPR) repeat protein
VFDEAVAYAARAIETAAELASPVSLAVAHLFKAMALASRGDFTQARIDAEVAVRQCETHGVVSWLPAAYAICGFARAHAAPSMEALAQVELGANAHAAMGVKTYLSWITRLWAEALLLNGDDDAARGKGERALGLAREFGERGEEAESLLLLAGVAAKRQVFTAARALYSEAIELAGKLGMRPVIARCHLGLGRAFWVSGASGEAKEELATAMTMLRDMGMTYWLEKAEADFSA